MSRLKEEMVTSESAGYIRPEHHAPFSSEESGPSDTEEKRSPVSVVEHPQHCALCFGEFRVKSSTHLVCGHLFHSLCLKAHWDQSGLTAVGSCPLCGKRSRRASGGPAANVEIHAREKIVDHYKFSLRTQQRLTEGPFKTESETLLNMISTYLYITEAQSEKINKQHEIWQLETTSKLETLHAPMISCRSIFLASPGRGEPIRVILTKGLASVGKTYNVQNFTQDWAHGLENQDVDLLIPLPFTKLNLIKDERHSLHTVVLAIHPFLQQLTAEMLATCNSLFILDGLNESRFSLDFQDDEIVSDVRQKSSVPVLLTNLIKGNLLKSASVWITSRPAAANQIPPNYVDRFTEIRGFTDAQKEQYFRIRFTDEELCSRILSHIKSSRSLDIMCQIPVCCWITATVLDHIVSTDQSKELPKTMTSLYSHFLLDQTELWLNAWKVLLKLGKLAFEHLDAGNIFHQDDLERYALDVRDTSAVPGVFEKVLKIDSGMYNTGVAFLHVRMYSFTHWSIQEFLAAVYIFHCYTNSNTEVLKGFLCVDDDDSFIDDDDDDSFIDDDDDDDSFIDDGDDDDSFIDDADGGDDDDDDSFIAEDNIETNTCRYPSSLDIFLKKAMAKSLESEHGHLDLFVRFLYGLSLMSNQTQFREVLCHADNGSTITQKVLKDLKEWNTNEISPDRSMNLFSCLVELEDQSVRQKIQLFLKSGDKPKQRLSDIHCSALAYMLLTTEEVLDELDLNKYKASIKGKQRLLPAVRNSRRAQLRGCELSGTHCKSVALALSSSPSYLRELNLRDNYLGDSGVKLLSCGLESPQCRLAALRLRNCEVGPAGCDHLASALMSNPFHLRELDLSYNNLRDSGVTRLCDYLKSSRCQLKILSTSHLRELELSKNKLHDSGVKELCDFLKSPRCGLEILKLSECRLTHERCYSLGSVLDSGCCRLRELNLSRNKIKDLGVRHLCVGLKSPRCKLQHLSLQKCELSWGSCPHLLSALKSNPKHLRELDLSDNELPESGVKLLSDLVESLDYGLEILRFSSAGSTVTFTGHQKTSHMKEKDERSEFPDISFDQFKDEPGPGPSNTRLDHREKSATPEPHGGYPSTSKSKLDVSEDKTKESLEDEDQLLPNDAKMLQQLPHSACDEMPTTETNIFSPEQVTKDGKSFYRFRFPCPGVFQCALTELMFVMAQEAEILYRNVQWDETLLRSAQKMAAGLLFDIRCSEGAAVCRIGLPHCEIVDALLSEGLLSVAHCTENEMHFLDPLEITDTHVVVRVPHFSGLGIVKKIWSWLGVKNLNNNLKQVCGQVLLFLRQPNPKTKRQKLNVFLLPRNIYLEKVSAQQRHSQNIQAPSECKLIIDRYYNLDCAQGIKIQPKRAQFDQEYGPNYHPTFEIRLPTGLEEVSLTVKDQDGLVVWEHDVDLLDFGEDISQVNVIAGDTKAEETLRSCRTEIINRISDPNLNKILDKLQHQSVLNSEEADTFMTKGRAEKARCLIDNVHRKGSKASAILINAICEVDSHLSKQLKLS